MNAKNTSKRIIGSIYFQPDCLHFAPPLVAFCCHNSDVKPHHLENLMHIKVGAAPVGETLINQFREKAPHVLFREGKK